MPFHVHERGRDTVLWEDDLVIRNARNRVDWQNRLRQYEQPKGDLKDRLALTAAQVLAFDLNAGSVVAQQRGSVDALFIVTRWHGPDEGLSYEAKLARSGLVISGKIFGGSEAIGDQLLEESDAVAAALNKVLDGIDRDWRSRLLVDVSLEGTARFDVPSVSVDDWLSVLARVESVSLVRDIQINELGLPLGRLEVRYTGRLKQVFEALAEAGLQVEQILGEQDPSGSEQVKRYRLTLDG